MDGATMHGGGGGGGGGTGGNVTDRKKRRQIQNRQHAKQWRSREKARVPVVRKSRCDFPCDP